MVERFVDDGSRGSSDGLSGAVGATSDGQQLREGV